jgi:hypothetical protein
MLRPVQGKTAAHEPIPESAPPTEHIATVRPYRSTEIGRQLTGWLQMKASRWFADLAPHRHCKLFPPRQSWLLSGASTPIRRMRSMNLQRVAIDHAGKRHRRGLRLRLSPLIR